MAIFLTGASRKWKTVSIVGISCIAIGVAWLAIWRQRLMHGNPPDWLIYEARPPLVARLLTIVGFWVLVIGVAGLVVALIKQRRGDRSKRQERNEIISGRFH